ncbi:MAG TPA: cytochrome c peroxidase, partial [Saprospiraceae bacterium]|nr:cytochrome c peroxidase [Saprospiraceae bacterium]
MKNLTGIRSLILLFIIVLSFSFCKKEEQLPYKYETLKLVLPATLSNYANPNLPAHMANIKELVSANVTDAGATLGRVLFYDTKLSRTNNIACASCHHQQNGFADKVKFSAGFDGLKTLRNSSSIANPIESSAYFWDGREKDLAKMVLQPVKNHIEMGLDQFDVMVKKLQAASYYGPLFKNAFGDEAITKERIASGLRQFLQSMVCGSAKFDEVDPFDWGDPALPADFNVQERLGANLFFGKALCSNCHNSPFSNGFSRWADIGLETIYTDKGLGSLEPGQDGKFKIPSLRNVALSAPYMHDGRFETLLDVVN